MAEGRFAGRVVLVTSAGAKIGLVLAGAACRVRPADVSREVACIALVAGAMRRFGRLDASCSTTRACPAPISRSPRVTAGAEMR